jgi:hypothetical protein
MCSWNAKDSKRDQTSWLEDMPTQTVSDEYRHLDTVSKIMAVSMYLKVSQAVAVVR